MILDLGQGYGEGRGGGRGEGEGRGSTVERESSNLIYTLLWILPLVGMGEWR